MKAVGESNWAKIETDDSYHKESVWFYAWKVYYGNDLLVMETDGEISEWLERFTYGFHWSKKCIW